MLRPFVVVCKALEHGEASVTNEEGASGPVLHAGDRDMGAAPSQITRFGFRYPWWDLEIDKEAHPCELNLRNASLLILGSKSD